VGEPSHGVGDWGARLLDIAAALTSEQSEEAVRRRVVEGFRAAGLQAEFRPAPAPGQPASGVLLALSEGGPNAEHLWVEGRHSAETVAFLRVFGRQVGSALAHAHQLFELRRTHQELQVIAEVARLAARPAPESLDALLARIIEPLGADAVVLHAPEPQAEELVLLAQAGLSEEDRGHFATYPFTRGLIWASLDEGLFRGSQEGNALRAATSGRFSYGAAVRLVQAKRFLGTLQMYRRGGGPFSPEAQRLLLTFAGVLVATVEQQRFQAEAQRQLSETTLLLELARTTSGTLELSAILDAACDFLTRLVGATGCFILLHDASQQLLRGAAASQDAAFLKGLVIPTDSEMLIAEAARRKRPAWVEDVRREENLQELALCHAVGASAALYLPLVLRDELIGVVALLESRAPRHFSSKLVELAQASIAQVALGVANARLYASLKESYAELAQTRAEMVKRERLAALGELSAVVAHEVRNPLGVLFNAVSSLRRLMPAHADAQLLLGIVREEGDRLNRIVSELLDFARPTGPQLELEDVGRLVRESLEAARVAPRPEDSEVKFDLELEPDLPQVPLDRQLMQQALVNLAVNAAQAMPQGGTVTVRVRADDDGRLRVEVSDEGPGIPPDVLPRVFEPFFTTKAKGTGLGLAVVRRIVEDHQGEVQAHSRPGQGATFVLKLPMTSGAGRRSP
jgi:signal transduction histidine kinase